MLIVRLVLRRVRVRLHWYIPMVLLLVLRVVLRLLLVLRLLPVVLLLRRAIDRLCSPGETWGTPRRRRNRCRAFGL